MPRIFYTQVIKWLFVMTVYVNQLAATWLLQFCKISVFQSQGSRIDDRDLNIYRCPSLLAQVDSAFYEL